MTADVVVIGAGCAGLSAATRLSAAGRRVVVVDEAPRLGGRTSAFTDRQSGERVDNGQHALFGCYRETYAWLREVGADHLAPLQPGLQLTMADANGRAATLSCPAWPAPLHLLAGVLNWRAVSLADRLSALRLAPLLTAARRHGPAAVAARVDPSLTVTSWLAAHGQSAALCHWLWRPLAIAALNQSPESAAAPPFVRVVAELFGPRPEDAAIGIPTVPLDALCADPARRFIESRGGEVRMGERGAIEVDHARPDRARVMAVRTPAGRIETRAVVCAVPWHAFDRVWADAIPEAIAGLAGHARAMTSSPIVTVNLWFENLPAVTTPFTGLVDGPMHWVFDKRAIVAQGGASHIAVVASGADDVASLGNDEVIALTRQHLAAAIPACGQSRLRHGVVVRERRATFSLAPGQPPRPATRTPIGGLVLAGDWTDTGLPATIEGAVVSGHRAAAAILEGRPDVP